MWIGDPTSCLISGKERDKTLHEIHHEIRAAQVQDVEKVLHDIIDGAPAARFSERLKDLIESGYGLDDSTVAPEQAGAEGASKQKVDATRNALS